MVDLLDEDELVEVEEDALEHGLDTRGEQQEGTVEVELSEDYLVHILVKQNIENVDVGNISHLNLDRQNIRSIPTSVLEGFSSVTNIYLQHNCLETLDFCKQLKSLRFLCVSNNKLKEVRGLEGLQALRVLDLSFNFLHAVDVSALPESLQFLMVKGNPCSQEEGEGEGEGEGEKIETLVEELRALPNLIEVDGKRLKSSLLQSDTKVFSFSERRRQRKTNEGDHVKRMEEEIEEQIERDIAIEKAKLQMRDDKHLSHEVQRIKNTIDSLHEGNAGGVGSASNSYVNFRPAVDGLMHHARTEMINKVDAMKERCRIRRLNTQEYSDEIAEQISKMKQQLREKPFKSMSRPSTASSSKGS